jgi:hypothetical protein
VSLPFFSSPSFGFTTIRIGGVCDSAGTALARGALLFPGDSPPPFNNPAFINAFAQSFTSFIINLDPNIKGRKPVKGKSRKRRKMKTRTASDRRGHLGEPMSIGDQEQYV